MRSAIRKLLLVLAILASFLSGVVAGFSIDGLIRFAQFSYLSLLSFLVGVALAFAFLVLHWFVLPPLHWQRVQARSDRWVDCVVLLTLSVIGLVTVIWIFTFDLPTWSVLFIWALIVVGAAAFVARGRGNADPLWDGRCPICGYDLRGLPEPRCPECGTEFQFDEEANNPPV